MRKTLDKFTEKFIEKIMEQRERVLIAFIAQHGCKPDDVEQIIRHTPEGVVWYLRKKETV